MGRAAHVAHTERRCKEIEVSCFPTSVGCSSPIFFHAVQHIVLTQLTFIALNLHADNRRGDGECKCPSLHLSVFVLFIVNKVVLVVRYTVVTLGI